MIIIRHSRTTLLITHQVIIFLLFSFDCHVYSFRTTPYNLLSKQQQQQQTGKTYQLLSTVGKSSILHFKQQQQLKLLLLQNDVIRIDRKKNFFRLFDNNNNGSESSDDTVSKVIETDSTNKNKVKEGVILSRQDFIRDSLVKKIRQEDNETSTVSNRRNLLINTITVGLLGVLGISTAYLFQSTVYTPNGFQRIYPTQFIAAIGNPNDNSGTNVNEWGIWNVDPGPRGVYLRDYEKELVSNNNINPVYQWKFNTNDWWVEEHGIIMESPKFTLQSGRYLVTGGRLVTTGITINTDNNTWKFDDPTTTLYDVTHLPCRSARYTPSTTGTSTTGSSCSPNNASLRNFPVSPGAVMPNINGCSKQDYAVLFIVGKAI